MKRRCWEKVISLVLAGAMIVNAPCNYVSAEDLFFSSEIENQEYEPAEEVEPGEEAGATEEMKPGEKAESTEETESDEEAKSAEQVEATKTPDEDFFSTEDIDNTLTFEETEDENSFFAEMDSSNEEGIYAAGTCGEQVTWIFDNGVLTISGEGEITKWPWKSEYGSQIAQIIIEEGVTAIQSGGQYDPIFGNCTSLETVVLPSTLERIGNWAFYGCTNLREINLKETVKTIGSYAFYGCTALTEADLTGVKSIEDHGFYACTALKNVVLQDGLEKIGDTAFCDTGLLTVSLPDTVTEIGNGVFDGSTRKSLTYVKWTAGVPAIPAGCFTECNALKKVEIPEGVTKIESNGQYSAAFFKCSNLDTITLPSTLETIGDWTFSGCTGLTNLLLKSNVSEIGENTFSGCENLKLSVYPGSYAEQYAIDHEMDYDYDVMRGNLIVSLEEPCIYEGLTISAVNTDRKVSRKIDSNMTYPFYALDPESEYTVIVENAYGDVLFSSEPVNVTSSESEYKITGIAPAANIEGITFAEETDITNQVGIKWYCDGTLYAQGARLYGVPVGKNLTAEVILSKENKFTYKQPKQLSQQVTEGDNSVKFVLEKLETISAEGIIRSEGTLLPGVKVEITQNTENIEKKTKEMISGEDGKIHFIIPDLPGTIAFSCKGYKTCSMSIDAFLESKEVELEKIGDVKLNLSANYTTNEGIRQSVTDWSNILVSVAEVESIQQDAVLILKDKVETGTTLTVNFSSADGTFEDTSVSYTVRDKNETVSVDLYEYGAILLKNLSQNETSVRSMVFDTNGKLIWSESVDSGNVVKTEVMKDGSYKVVLIQEYPEVVYPSDLASFDALGIVEETDYMLKSVQVTKGNTTEITVDTVPEFDASRCFYTESSETVFSVSKKNTVAGNSFSLRAKTAFREEYKEQISNVKWKIQYSDNCECLSGTISVNGSFNTDVELQEGVVTIPVSNPSDMLRMCFVPVDEGKIQIDGYIEFELNGQKMTQPVGNESVVSDGIEINIPENTMENTVTITGKAPADSYVFLYDNSILVGENQTKQGGSWSVEYTFEKSLKKKDHVIYAEILLASGIKVRTKSGLMHYIYSSDPTRVSKVTMYNLCHDLGQDTYQNVIVYDFIHPENSTIRAYNFYPDKYPTFTFVTEFEGGELQKLSNVKVHVYLSNGSERVLDAVLDEETNTFISTTDITNYYAPVNVKVSFDYDSGNYFDESMFEDVVAKYQYDIPETGEPLPSSDELFPEESYVLTPINIEEYREYLEEEDVALLQEINDAVEVYNENIDQLPKLKEMYDTYVAESEKTLQEVMELVGTTSEETINGEEFKEKYNVGLGESYGKGDEFKVQSLNGGLVDVERVTGPCSKITVNFFGSRNGGGYRAGTSEVNAIEHYLEKNGYTLYAAPDFKGFTMDVHATSCTVSCQNVILEKTEIIDGITKNYVYYPNRLSFRFDYLLDEIYGTKSLQTYSQEITLDGTEICFAESAGEEITFSKDTVTVTVVDTSRVDDTNKIQDVVNQIKMVPDIIDSIHNTSDTIEYGAMMVDDIFIAKNTRLDDFLLGMNSKSPEAAWSMAEVLSKIDGAAGKVIDATDACGRLLSKIPGADWIALGSNIWEIWNYGTMLNDAVLNDGDASLIWGIQLGLIGEILGAGLTGLGMGALIGSTVLGATISWPLLTALGAGLGIASLLYGNKIGDDYKKFRTGRDELGSTPILDPSGYIYEAVPSNRLSGATVTCEMQVSSEDIYGDTYTDIQSWDAENYGQTNPLLTTGEGEYAWDVPNGTWRVKAEMEGYETTYSDWLEVPPPQLDVNLGLVNKSAPAVTSVYAYPDYVDITFSRYLETENLDNAVTLSGPDGAVSGKIEFLNAEKELSGERLLVSKIRFIPDNPVASGTSLQLLIGKEAVSYAGTPFNATENGTYTVREKIEQLSAQKSVGLNYNEEQTLKISATPAKEAAGKTVTVKNLTEVILSVQETEVKLDENGCAEIHIKGKLAGTGLIQYDLQDTELTAKTEVHIENRALISSIQLFTDSKELCVGGKTNIVTSVLPEKANAKAVRLTVSDPSIAYIDENGALMAKGEGTIQVIASATDGSAISAQTSVTIVSACKYGHSFTNYVSDNNATCTKDGTKTAKCDRCEATDTVSNPGSKKSHQWGAYQSDHNATCTKDGTKTAKCNNCTATNTISDPGSKTGHKWGKWNTISEATVFTEEVQNHICTVCGTEEGRKNGNKLSPSMNISADSIVLKTGQKTTRFAVSEMAKGDSVKSWNSSNPAIVNVSGKEDGTCIITAKKKTGSAKITITLKSGLKKTINVKVQKKAVATKKITGIQSKATISKGKNLSLKPVLLPITSVEKITYSTSDKKVATVNSKGKITAKGPGIAKITVKAGKKKAYCTVTVPGIANVKSSATIKKGKSITLKPKKYGTNSKLVYTSSNTKVAVVNKNGKIAGKKKGTAYITVKAGSLSVKCKVTVK